ncbi:hypothetical protein [Methylorubrum populi]|uniref:hypothetical protein n=1 Tax=Methylorubrum populi TaxID=223967 RepID=UPI00186AD2F3|nr:hypothetical protein [Methylorubrum populi]
MSLYEGIAIIFSAIAILAAVATGYATWRAPSNAERLADQLRKLSSETEFRARLKFDCLRRVAGHRTASSFRPEWFAALNEIYVVFNDSPAVLQKMVAFQRSAFRGSASNEDLLDLIKAMMDDLKLDRSMLDDGFLLSPFGS